MRIKTKAVPNTTANEIPVDVLGSSDFVSSHAGEFSVSAALRDSGTSDGIRDVTALPSYPVTSMGLSGNVHRLGHVSDAVMAVSSIGQPVMGSSVPASRCSVAGSFQDDGFDNESPVVAVSPHRMGFPPVVPAHVYTVDGSVSTFQSVSSLPSTSVHTRQQATTQGLSNAWDVGHVPMVLDFSSGDVVLHSESLACMLIEFNLFMHRLRTGMCYITRHLNSFFYFVFVAHIPYPPVFTLLFLLLYIHKGSPSIGEADSVETQGPAAPPQREGAPLEYVSFGRCDQACQHCGAFFWLEEKKMVKLFRTARDKLQQADIPNFNIRLFGVAGANQYELPTADSIGAIVFDGGPESATDYDVVIERHSGEPESVNKLHPAYMALQFPLLFIYGEEGYHLKLTLRNPDGSDQEEKKMSMKFRICVNFRNFRLTLALIHMFIGRKMELTVDASTSSKNIDTAIVRSRQFAYLTELNSADNSKFIEVKVYRKWTTVKIPGFTPTAFSCMLLDKKGSAIQANADLKEKIRFDHDLQIDYVYRIQGFGFEKADSWGKTLDNDMTLCFGKYTQADLLEDKDFPNHYFNFAAFNQLNARLERKNPILTDINTPHILILNHSYKHSYNEPTTTIPQLEIQTDRLTNWEDEKNRNRVPFATLLQIDPKTQQRVLFTQNAMILRIDTDHNWYYQKCDECGGKLTYGYLHGQCHQYGTKPNPINSYCFRIIVTDGTANAVMSCFTPQTDGLIKDVNSLLKEVETNDPTIIPRAILALQNTRHLFQFQFATPASKGAPTFVLKKIMDNPQGTLAGSSATPSSPPTGITESLAHEESTPPPATPASTENTPADALAETQKPLYSGTRKDLFGSTTEKEETLTISPTNEKEGSPASKKQKKD
ncbi:hypothetical protein CTI12_AA009830 [Artemisia annua]|uniref:Nucleic acid-binding, OB-fold protein n=1 Tax=Artemisia annua TaxID=35608 RepID=A0A2U1QMT6_ARTAN|nr:hypothetical protein CTI12_AA009830 [Artemisia annua]